MGNPFDFNPKFNTSFSQLPGVNVSGNALKGKGSVGYSLDKNNSLDTEVNLFKGRAAAKYTTTSLLPGGKTTFQASTSGKIGVDTSFEAGTHGNVYGYVNASMSNGSVTAGVGYKNDNFSAKAFYNSNASMQNMLKDINESAMQAGVTVSYTLK